MIVGLNGYKGAGKDTVAAYLRDRYGFEVRKFAGLLYESAAALLGVTPSLLDGLKNDLDARVALVCGGGALRRLSVRQFLQRYGTEAHRDVFGQDFWIDALLTEPMGDRVVISDARFENELHAVHEAGGIVVRVERWGSDDPHPSEVAPLPELVDFHLDNTRDLAWLYEQVDSLCARLLITPESST